MKRSTLFITLFTVLFGGFIGYDPITPSQGIQATPVSVLPMYAPRPEKSLFLDIDLNTDKVTIGEQNSKDATVIVNKKDVETRLEYVIVEKEVYVENTIKSTKLLNRLMPLEKPVLGLKY